MFCCRFHSFVSFLDVFEGCFSSAGSSHSMPSRAPLLSFALISCQCFPSILLHHILHVPFSALIPSHSLSFLYYRT